jgi:hypothetical protein
VFYHIPALLPAFLFAHGHWPVSVSAVINGTSHTAAYYAAPDYLAIGTDADYFL